MNKVAEYFGTIRVTIRQNIAQLMTYQKLSSLNNCKLFFLILLESLEANKVIKSLIINI
jgi:hypothetical protein